MGYAVDYKPQRTRARRTVPKSRRQRMNDIRSAIRYNIRQLEHDTTGADTVRRDMAIRILHLNAIAPKADPTGDHVIQQLISEGVVPHPRNQTGVQVFDRDDLITSLKAYAGC